MEKTNGHIFNREQLVLAESILANPLSKLESLSSSEIRELAVVWCYYSGKIEGNTYTYVETETLLKDGITPEKRYEDAKMLKNLHNTFVSELEYIYKNHNRETIDERTLFRVHSTIIDGLISDEDKGQLRDRPVRISGTEYVPPRDRLEILQLVGKTLYEQERFVNPLERAVFLHCNIARIQPFIDGNKRTSRMMESIVMMNDGIVPVYSAKDADILHYRRGLMHFYETGDYVWYADYVLHRLQERLEAIT